MGNLVIMKSEQALTTSLIVAKQFKKNHRDVLRAIDKLKKDVRNFAQMFMESSVKDSYGRPRRIYYMNRDGFSLLAMGFTGKRAIKFKLRFIKAFDQMETYIKSHPVQSQIEAIYERFPQIPRTFPQALRQLADQQDLINKQKPKVDYYDSQMRNPGLMTTTEIAKDFGWSANRLNRELHKRHVIFKQGNHWVLYQKYADKGYTQYEPYPYKHNNGTRGIRNNLKWTQRGRKFIYDLLAKDDIHPVAEEMDLLEDF